MSRHRSRSQRREPELRPRAHQVFNRKMINSNYEPTYISPRKLIICPQLFNNKTTIPTAMCSFVNECNYKNLFNEESGPIIILWQFVLKANEDQTETLKVLLYEKKHDQGG